MKTFSKSELIGIGIIFLVLIGISIPNFAISLRRARDQVRRDDLGALVQALDQYVIDFGELPPASPNGRIMDCVKPGTTPSLDKKGNLIVDLVPCDWGKDALIDLMPGSKKVYMQILPRDPDYLKNGSSYLYFTDGQRYQLYAAFEGKDEAEYDPQIVALNLKCGTMICNTGRPYKVPINISIEEYDRKLLKSQKSK